MTDETKHDAAGQAAAFAATFPAAHAPSSVVDRAKYVFLDTVGVCLRGGTTDYVREAANTIVGLCSGSPLDGVGATVLATGERQPPAMAALLNAASGTTLELDEGNQRSAHPGIHTVPAVLAVAEHCETSGTELLDALLVGYEVSARLGDLIRPLKTGLHPHGGWGPVGAAVATGRLLGFDADRMAEAIRIAVNPFVATHWNAAFTGATVRDFYAGVCCSHGIVAAALAAAGVTGVERAVEECLLPYTAGRERTTEEIHTAFESLGEQYYLLSSYFKVHAACRYSHAPVEAVAALQATYELDPSDINRLVVRTFELGTLLDEQSPRNVLNAKFSTPYVLAARLVLGRSDAEAFTEEYVEDECIQALASKIEVTMDPVFEERVTKGEWGAAVEIELTDGSTLTETVRDARGGGTNPFASEEIEAKFDSLVAPIVIDESALRKRLLGVEDVENVEHLLAPLR